MNQRIEKDVVLDNRNIYLGSYKYSSVDSVTAATYLSIHGMRSLPRLTTPNAVPQPEGRLLCVATIGRCRGSPWSNER